MKLLKALICFIFLLTLTFCSKKEKLLVKDINEADILKNFKNLQHIENEYNHPLYIGTLNGNLYGIGNGISGDGMRTKNYFLENNYSNFYKDIMVNCFSLNKTGSHKYIFVEFGDNENDKQHIISYDFEKGEEVLIKEVFTNDNFYIHNTYLQNNYLYELRYVNSYQNIEVVKTNLQTSEEIDVCFIPLNESYKDGILTNYGFVYITSVVDSNISNIHLNNEVVKNVNLPLKKIVNYNENIIIFATNDGNLLIYNLYTNKSFEINDKKEDLYNISTILYNDKLMYMSNEENTLYQYDITNGNKEKLFSIKNREYDFKIHNVINDILIMTYNEPEKILIEHIAFYNINSNEIIFVKYNNDNTENSKLYFFEENDLLTIIRRNYWDDEYFKYNIQINDIKLQLAK